MFRRTVLLFAAVLLTACGFHLKGVGREAVVTNEPIMLDAAQAPAETIQAIHETFARNGLTLSDDATAVYTIRLEDFVDSRFESVVGGEHGQSRMLDLRKGFSATILQHGEVLASQPLISEASVHYHSEQYLGNLADDQNAQRALQRDNADKLLRFFQATLAARP